MPDKKKELSIISVDVKDAKFYELDADRILVIDKDGSYLLNPKIGKIYQASDQTIPPKVSFKIKGRAIISLGGERMTIICDFEEYTFSYQLGKLGIYTPAPNLKETIKRIYFRSNDLNVGDDFDWSRGHSAYSGNGLEVAIKLLKEVINHEDKEIRYLAALTIYELLRHVDHFCFNPKDVRKLTKLAKSLFARITLETNRQVRSAIRKAEKCYQYIEKHLKK
jgi:hypothetical protein